MIITVFDFETCGPTRLTAVELGVAVFDDGRLVETRSWRFFPIEPSFTRRTTEVSGIRREHVEGLSTFDSFWDQMRPYFQHKLVAHQATFDVDVLCNTLDHFQLVRPDTTAHCTHLMAKWILGREGGCGLGELCDELRIPLVHHSAASDATATGYLLNHLACLRGGITACLDAIDFRTSVTDWQPGSATDSSANHEEDDFVVDSTVVSISGSDSIALSSKHDDADGSAHANVTLNIWNDFVSTVVTLDQPTFLAGWRLAVSGEPAAGKSKFTETVRTLGAACHDEGKLLKTKNEGVAFSPTNVLLIAEEMLTKVMSGRSGTGKLKQAAEMRFGRRPKPIKLVAERDFYQMVLRSLNAGHAEFDLDTYVEDSDVIGALWAKLDPANGESN